MKTALLLVLLAAPLAPTDGAVSLAARPAQGDVFQERERFWTATTGAAEGDEVNRPAFSWGESAPLAELDDASPVACETVHEDEVLAVEHGARSRIRRTFVTSSRTRAEPGADDPTPRCSHASFEGQSIVLAAMGGETRLVGEIDGEEELAPSDLDLAPRWERALPPSPVEIGDTWTLAPDVAARLLEPLASRRATAECKLARVEASESGPVACIELTLHGSLPDESGATTVVDSTGLLRWDVAGARLIEVTLSGELDATDREGAVRTRHFGLVHETRRIE